MSPIGVLRLDGVPAARLAALSRNALDRTLQQPAELVVATLSDEAVVLGALQRSSELTSTLDASVPIFRRGSGGAEVRVGRGTLWMQLALERSDTLVACEPGRLLNRHVRPVLRALTKVGALARYFDRDWISVAKRPIGIVALAHDAGSGRALVEIVLAVTTPFAVRARPSYLGASPATLAEVGSGSSLDLTRVGDAIAAAHADVYGRSLVELSPLALPADADAEAPRGEPGWEATRDEAIGILGAGRDRSGAMRIGGELMVSRDALATLERQLAATDADALGRVVGDALGSPGVALVGVRSLLSVRDVVAEALAKRHSARPTRNESS
jgi:hypothetical protein